MKILKRHVRIAKVIGENEDGLTLFVPKDEDGIFHLSEGDTFNTIMFLHQPPDGDGTLEPWLPWEDADAE